MSTAVSSTTYPAAAVTLDKKAMLPEVDIRREQPQVAPTMQSSSIPLSSTPVPSPPQVAQSTGELEEAARIRGGGCCGACCGCFFGAIAAVLCCGLC
ncbi:hypothetical protein [Phaffia rhodozyma]|uniref:Uncharacterized protein n=1 Tax=Phaffia rhodozyma TaxID=264483 RepID=A0A0F7SVH7_PHARH|nr:hypothetical protein [Phaffia rhodozyma]